MAMRRMLNSKITDGDDFLCIPPSSQALYMHLVIHADDDGFVNNPRTLVRMVGCTLDDLEILKKSTYLISFVSGVICITHWNLHNWIRKDRYTPSIMQERQYVTVLKDKTYAVMDKYKTYVSHSDSQVGSQDGSHPDSQGDCQVGDGWYDGLADSRHTKEEQPVDNFYGEYGRNPDSDWC